MEARGLRPGNFLERLFFEAEGSFPLVLNSLTSSSYNNNKNDNNNNNNNNIAAPAQEKKSGIPLQKGQPTKVFNRTLAEAEGGSWKPPRGEAPNRVANPSLAQWRQRLGFKPLHRGPLNVCCPFPKQRPREETSLSDDALKRTECGQMCGSGVRAGFTAPGCRGPAAPHGGGWPLGRRPTFPHGGGFGFRPWSLALALSSGPYLIPGHGCSLNGLGTDGK
ncbi:hypothetical protein H920_07098 [Fukomys damarensis]|uniref:Uncharacterized protein n=1 Tax=Fukomys damarensis TaxID=885580 RepID=A0A091E8G5_FUKDA|nr:hypothetical protein H920_07098 [Fukomys damarensis]